MTAKTRLATIWKSFTSLPAWVQIWVGLILIPVNAAGFLMLDTYSGMAVALAALVVVVTNVPIMWYYAGMNKAMSIPHLFAWIPLHIALIGRLSGHFGSGEVGTPELSLAVLVLLINSISLAFDLLDSWRWVQGDRATPGVDQA